MKSKKYFIKNNVLFLNCTPHNIKFDNDIVLEPSGYLLTAKVVETDAIVVNDFRIVKSKYIPTQEGLKEIGEILDKYKDKAQYIFCVSSALSTQAYKPSLLGDNRIKVVGMVQISGRTSNENKIVSTEKFIIGG